jgi:hypothetical protein
MCNTNLFEKWSNRLRRFRAWSVKIKKARKVLFFTILFFPVWLQASAEQRTENVRLIGKLYIYQSSKDGNPHLFETWQRASITLENGAVATDVKVKLNVITNDLLFYNEELRSVFLIDKETVTSFTLNSGTPDSMLFVKYRGDDVGFKLKENDFIQVLVYGTMSLYLKHKADVYSATELNTKDKIVHYKLYFIQGRSKIVSVKPKPGSIYPFFPETKKEVRKLARSHRLTSSNSKSLKELIDLINKVPSLLETMSL